MKLTKQPNLSSCGPTAIVNTLKLLGKHQTRKDIYKLQKECKTSRTHGTSEKNVKKALDNRGFKTRYIEGPTMSEILNHLNNNGKIILGYDYICDDGTFEGHYIVINSYKGRNLQVVNHISLEKIKRLTKVSEFKTIDSISRIELREYLKTKYFEGIAYHSVAILVYPS